MRVAHNLSALNTTRLLSATTKQQSIIAEKLSSGCKINRASDNAAGLSISEKMRAQIRGLNQASRNAQDGISLIETADGALSEVNNILHRMRELSVQASNGTATDEDRTLIQTEIKELLEEVNRISNDTEFNDMKLLDGNLKGDLSTNGFFDLNNNLDFKATPITNGPPIGNTTGGYDELKRTLKEEIIPQVVNKIINAYSPAYDYLKGCETGIGLQIENIPRGAAMTKLASVGTTGGNADRNVLPFRLSVNVGVLDFNSNGSLTEDSRTYLETIISHEFVHAFMDEALTVGMTGYADGSTRQNTSIEYPLWFIEGMAQTSSGGFANCNDFVNGNLGITTDSTDDQIRNAIRRYSLTYSGGDQVIEGLKDYGTGYLACMYMGQLASGESEITIGSIRKGVSTILSQLINGKSLDDVVKDNTGYTNINDFANRFGDNASVNFIKDLTSIVGEGNGSILSGSLTDVDLLPNEVTSENSGLFKLDTEKDIVYNQYPNEVKVSSGGSKSSAGTAPVSNYADTIRNGSTAPTTPTTPPTTPVQGTKTIDLSNISSVDGIDYDAETKILTVVKNGEYTLKGTGEVGVNVVVKEGIEAKITLDNANINARVGSIAGDEGTSEVINGITIRGNSHLILNLVRDNKITSNTFGAGIAVSKDATLDITGDGTLIVEGGNGSAGIGGCDDDSGTINIKGGTITATGGRQAAGIGGIARKSGGTINITGGTVNATGGQYGAGIGSGTSGTGSTINITGGTVNATGGQRGAGIGGGRQASSDTVTINGKTAVVTAKAGASGVTDIGDRSGDSANISNGIVISNGNGTVYGRVEVNKRVSYGNGTLTVTEGSSIIIKSEGVLTGTGNVIDNGVNSVDNHGKLEIPNIDIFADKLKNFIEDIENQITKKIIKPSQVDVGGGISIPSSQTMHVTYNGGQSTNITGKWKVISSSGEVNSGNISSIVVEQNNTFRYVLEYDLSDKPGLYFSEDGIVSRNYADLNSLNNVSLQGGKGVISDNGKKLTYTFLVTPEGGKSPSPASSTSQGKLKLQIGANVNQILGISIDGVSTSDLNIDSLSVLTMESSANAIDSCNEAINKVSIIRSSLGAYQNRLEHTIANLDNSSENLQASESRIRDLDMAKGMAEYSKYQVLSQVEQAMLSQANQMANNVLNLLRA